MDQITATAWLVRWRLAGSPYYIPDSWMWNLPREVFDLIPRSQEGSNGGRLPWISAEGKQRGKTPYSRPWVACSRQKRKYRMGNGNQRRNNMSWSEVQRTIRFVLTRGYIPEGRL